MWSIIQDVYEKNKDSYYETIFSLSNGYVGVRNTLDFESETAIPGVFFANIYDNSLVTNDEIVNAPNWLDFEILINNKKVSLSNVNILNFKRQLNMKLGIVRTYLKIKDCENRITIIDKTDLVHAKKYHNSLLFGKITAENHTSHITIRTFFNYSQGNTYMGGSVNPHVKTQHIKHTNTFYDENVLYIECETISSKQKIGLAHKFQTNESSSRRFLKEKYRIGEEITFTPNHARVYNFVKYVSFYNESDNVKDVKTSVLNELNKITSIKFSDLLLEHYNTWEQKWDLYKINIKGDKKAQQGVLFSIFHLLQAVYPLNNGTNIPSRGLTSEYHQGHFFFNTEIYCVPYFTYFDPNVAKSLLTFRFNGLPAAQSFAQSNGKVGARFPEQSDSTGNPAGPEKFYDLINMVEIEEWTGREAKFIGALCVYAIYKYYLYSKDKEFLLKMGLPILIEVSKYYNDILEYNAQKDHYEIKEVTGPDEYHMHVNNSYFTNYMVKETLELSISLINRFGLNETEKIMREYSLNRYDICEWKQKIPKIKFPKVENGIREQFDNYFDLTDAIITKYDENKRPIIEGEIKEIASKLLNNDSKIIKQSDIIMLMSLFRERFSYKTKLTNFEYYETRTVHESSLSTSHSALIAIDINNMDKAYDYFLNSVRFNLDFTPKENYINGIHLAGNAGGLLVLLEGFIGIKPIDDILFINPNLPKNWEELSLKINWRGNFFGFIVKQEMIHIIPEEINDSRFIVFNINGNEMSLDKEKSIRYNNILQMEEGI
ncbi:glycosyl hydrolase family 65 protein [Evansella clarkii]|uniref:glycosyl hydrolase family 65 protein n=1 Tax=Evansella clarkii TaxID=79879 RepID=UPI000B43C447|nr:glycosyl hydrolase family 65 protein [Evansella clarkii]